MAGGEGRRLRPYTDIFPKPLLPINETPIIKIILDQLKTHGIQEIILATNYKDDLLKMFLNDGAHLGVKISYSKEKKSLGTAGPLKLVEKEVSEDFIVMNGDILINLDFKELIKFHKENNSKITVVSKKIKIPLQYGMIKSDDNGKILELNEKPSLDAEISTGVYILNNSVLKYIPENIRYDMPSLIRECIFFGEKVLRFPYFGKWFDIGDVHEYQKVQTELNFIKNG